MTDVRRLRGIGVSPGIAMGEVLLAKRVVFTSRKEIIDEAQVPDEIERLRRALARTRADLVKVKELLQGGDLGELRSIRYLVGEMFDWEAVTGFRFDPGTTAGGVLRDRGAHVMYVVCWWLGSKPALVSCQNDAIAGPEAVTDVRFQHKGCQGEVKLSWLSKFTPRFEVVGDRARVQGGIYDTDSVLLTTNAGRKKRLKLPSFPRSYHDIARGMVGNFLDSMAGTAQPLVSGRDALPSIEFIDQCYREATRFDMPWYDLLRLPVPVSPAEVGHGL